MENIKIIAADAFNSTRRERRLFGEGNKIEIVFQKGDYIGVIHLIYHIDGSWEYDFNGADEHDCFIAIEKWINSIFAVDEKK